jgi:hypothetical protein
MTEQNYFITIFNSELDGGLAHERPDGVRVTVRFLLADRHIESERLSDMLCDAVEQDQRLIVSTRGGTILTGKPISLEDIVGWAIVHGYLDDPLFKATGYSDDHGAARRNEGS